MERRSFSSNSNQSTIGNYNSDHSTAFSTSSSQQLNGTHSLPSVLSSITSAAVSSGGVSTPNFTYSDVNVHRKLSNAIPFTPSPDDRSNNASQIGDLYNSSTLSAMQSSTTNAPNNNNHGLHQTGLNATASLANLGDYSMQMNELINDDNGDGLDMTFWENFDNFNYEADLVMNNSNSSQAYSTSQNKMSSKRSHDGSGSERKRKRTNESKDNSNNSKSLKDGTKGISASPLSHDIGQTLLKPNPNLSQHKKTSSLTTNFGTNILIGAPRPDVICIDDDEDDATNNNIGEFRVYGMVVRVNFVVERILRVYLT